MSTKEKPSTLSLGAADAAAVGLKQAMRRLAGTVSVIATRHDGRRFGMAATSVTSVSLDPPSLLVCVNKTTDCHRALFEGQRFSVNVLQGAQQAVSQRFSSPDIKGDQRFDDLGLWEETSDGVPMLADANAAILAEVDKVVDYGSHTIFIGKVIGVHLPEMAAPALVYFQGGYVELALS